MTSRASSPRAPRRVPEPQLPYPFLQYLLLVPGDYSARRCASGAER